MKRSHALSFAILLACVSPYAAQADTPTEVSSSDIPYVVTVTRTESAPAFIPSQVDVITEKDIANHAYTTLGDALQTVPGLAFVNTISSGSNGGSNVSLRGMNPNHTLVLVNGERITGDITRVKGVNLDYMLTDLDNVSRIEVLQGPSSALYGSEAMGGVINIVTKSADQAGGSIKTELTHKPGTSGTGYALDFNYRTGRQGKWEGQVFVGNRKTLPAYDNLGATLRYHGKSTPLRIGATYHINDHSQLEFDYNYEHHKLTWNSVLLSPEIKQPSKDDMKKMLPYMDTIKPRMIAMKELSNAAKKAGTVPGTPLDPEKYPGVAVGPEPNRFTVASTFQREGESQGASIRYKHTSENVDTKLNFHWGYFNEYFTSSATTAFRPYLPGQGNVPANLAHLVPPLVQKVDPDWSRAKHTEYSFEAQQVRALGDNHLLTYGLTSRIEQGSGTRIVTGTPDGSETNTVDGVTTTHPLYKTTLHDHALYLQDEWQLHEKWYLIPALRYDYSTKFGGQLSPKLGVTYSASPTWRLKANVGHGYATPGISELYESWSDAPIGNLFGNPDLKPEISNSYDFTVEHDIGRHSLSLTYFNNHVKDLIEVRPNGLAGNQAGYSFQNVKKAHLQGVTFSYRWALPKNWSTFFNYSYLDAKDTSANTRLGNRAKHTIQAGVTYTQGAWESSLWTTIYRNYLEVPYYGPSVIHNFATVDALLSYTFANRSRLYVGVTNIGNQQNALLGLAGREYRMGYKFDF